MLLVVVGVLTRDWLSCDGVVEAKGGSWWMHYQPSYRRTKVLLILGFVCMVAVNGVPSRVGERN